MSEIPFFFSSPTPKYFRDSGLFKNQKNFIFVTWCFERCCAQVKEVIHDNKKIVLQPYQFIFGRVACSEATGLSDDEIRTQQKRWETMGFLKKAPNKTPNRFTIYEWVLTAFLKDDPQQNPRSTPNKPPTNPHNQEDKKRRYKEDHQPYPSSKDRADGLTDELSSNQEKEEEKIQIYENVFMTQSILDDCIRIKGSIEGVKHAVEYVMRSPRRTAVIKDWPSTLAKWIIKNDIKPRIKENEEMAKRLSKLYENFSDGNGHRCGVFNDKKKDQVGLLFEPSSPYMQPFFIAYADSEFQEKASKYIRENKMQKGRITDS